MFIVLKHNHSYNASPQCFQLIINLMDLESMSEI